MASREGLPYRTICQLIEQLAAADSYLVFAVSKGRTGRDAGKAFLHIFGTGGTREKVIDALEGIVQLLKEGEGELIHCDKPEEPPG